MSKAQVHVLLVSDQAAPSLLPALDPELKPAEAVLMVSEKMRDRADALAPILRESGVKVTRETLPNEHDFGALENALLKVASERDGQAIALNVTGGTKLMALAAQSVAVAAGWAIFYVDVDTDEVLWLGKESRRQPLHQQMRLRHYLGGYGFTLQSTPTAIHVEPKHDDLLRTLVTQVGSLEHALGQLNWLAQQAERPSLSVTLTAQQQDSRGLEALLRHFEEAKVLRLTGDNLVFASAADRSFANGGWLEQQVFRSVCALSDQLGLRDKAANLVVVDGSGVKNEMDVAFMARNRLFVIECKTARMDQTIAPKANDTLFKLAEICRRVGGIGTRAMLASYRPLADAEQRLARALRVELIGGAELARLDAKLKDWVRR